MRPKSDRAGGDQYYVVVRRRCGDAWIALSSCYRELALEAARRLRHLEDAAEVRVEREGQVRPVKVHKRPE